VCIYTLLDIEMINNKKEKKNLKEYYEPLNHGLDVGYTRANLTTHVFF